MTRKFDRDTYLIERKGADGIVEEWDSRRQTWREIGRFPPSTYRIPEVEKKVYTFGNIDLFEEFSYV